jgi:hypothetical protein
MMWCVCVCCSFTHRVCVAAMSQASKKELARLKAQLAGGTAEKKRYIHCRKCHNDVKHKKFMIYPDARGKHSCQAKDKCTDIHTCPAKTEKKKKEFHGPQWMQLRVEQLEAEVNVITLQTFFSPSSFHHLSYQ